MRVRSTRYSVLAKCGAKATDQDGQLNLLEKMITGLTTFEASEGELRRGFLPQKGKKFFDRGGRMEVLKRDQMTKWVTHLQELELLRISCE